MLPRGPLGPFCSDFVNPPLFAQKVSQLALLYPALLDQVFGSTAGPCPRAPPCAIGRDLRTRWVPTSLHRLHVYLVLLSPAACPPVSLPRSRRPLPTLPLGPSSRALFAFRLLPRPPFSPHCPSPSLSACPPGCLLVRPSVRPSICLSVTVCLRHWQAREGKRRRGRCKGCEREGRGETEGRAGGKAEGRRKKGKGKGREGSGGRMARVGRE